MNYTSWAKVFRASSSPARLGFGGCLVMNQRATLEETSEKKLLTAGNP